MAWSLNLRFLGLGGKQPCLFESHCPLLCHSDTAVRSELDDAYKWLALREQLLNLFFYSPGFGFCNLDV